MSEGRHIFNPLLIGMIVEVVGSGLDGLGHKG